MILWRKPRDYFVGSHDNVVYKHTLTEWLLPQAVAMKIKYNKRHVPVVINRETTNEAYYLYLSLRRIICGYRAS